MQRSTPTKEIVESVDTEVVESEVENQKEEKKSSKKRKREDSVKDIAETKKKKSNEIQSIGIRGKEEVEDDKEDSDSDRASFSDTVVIFLNERNEEKPSPQDKNRSPSYSPNGRKEKREIKGTLILKTFFLRIFLIDISFWNFSTRDFSGLFF